MWPGLGQISARRGSARKDVERVLSLRTVAGWLDASLFAQGGGRQLPATGNRLPGTLASVGSALSRTGPASGGLRSPLAPT